MSGVDVLALLDDLVADMGDTPGTTGQQVAQVRGAVAELIEALKRTTDRLGVVVESDADDGNPECHDDVAAYAAGVAALANVTGGAA